MKHNPHIVEDLTRLRDELLDRDGISEITMKINSCLYKGYPRRPDNRITAEGARQLQTKADAEWLTSALGVAYEEIAKKAQEGLNTARIYFSWKPRVEDLRYQQLSDSLRADGYQVQIVDADMTFVSVSW